MIIELQHDFPQKIINQLSHIFPFAKIVHLSSDSKYNYYFKVKREPNDFLNDILHNTQIVRENLIDKSSLFKNNKNFICKYNMQVIYNNVSSVEIEFKEKETDFLLNYYIGLNGWTLIASENKYWNLKYVVSIDEIQSNNQIIKYNNKDILYYMLYTAEIINALKVQGYDIENINLFEMFIENPEYFRELLYLNEMLVI